MNVLSPKTVWLGMFGQDLGANRFISDELSVESCLTLVSFRNFYFALMKTRN